MSDTFRLKEHHLRQVEEAALACEEGWITYGSDDMHGQPSWNAVGRRLYGGHVWLAEFCDDNQGRAHAAFCAAANPIVVLAMAEEIRRLRAGQPVKCYKKASLAGWTVGGVVAGGVTALIVWLLTWLLMQRLVW
jgi:hypothetical protein